MAIPAMALLQQHDASRDIVIEPAAWRRAAIEAQGAFGIGGVRNSGRNRAVKTRIRNWGRSELGAQSGHKNPPACL